ncbi:portal protein [Microbacterium phage MementoMori]|uniref:Portal protein n=1 Tax=Microbacterium phage MementoMori TaxID=2201436 RepID=A0A2Z4Q5C8_9CAUD|nr:portal protein [Microbacterium phage MementoMori]AWY05267.1 portal protein [Microbacterium phage MementoMori]
MATMSARTYVPIPGGPDPADLPDIGAITPEVKVPETPERPRPMQNSLVASAARVTGATIKDTRGNARGSTDSWQEDAWEMYDLVGEMRFLVNVLASQASKARFYVGTLADDPTDPPVPVTDTRLIQALEAIGDGPTGLAQITKRLYINLEVPGDGWLVGIPKPLMPDARRERKAMLEKGEDVPPMISLADTTLDDLVWRMLSVSEVKFEEKNVILTLGDDGEDDQVKTSPDDVYMIRVWDSHPRKAWEADSPTRSALPVLRELVGLTMHISAQIDSRLAGAGVLLTPASASKAAKIALQMDPDGPDDPFTDALIDAMITPISDRANASAYVPLIWTVPDEAVDKFKFLDFSKPLDAQAKEMRDEAIRRYALSADAPPELLLGVGSMNHWGAWLVQEDVVRAHLEPRLALVADALTTQYLRPVMESLGGWTPEAIENHVVWFDVEHLIVRISKGDDARQAYQDGVINAQTYRDALGFSEDDAPEADSADPAVSTALEMVSRAPSLAQTPGLIELVRQIRAIMSGDTSDDVAVAPVAEEEPAPEGEPVEGPPAPEPAEEPEPLPDSLSAAIQNVARVRARRNREMAGAGK